MFMASFVFHRKALRERGCNYCFYSVYWHLKFYFSILIPDSRVQSIMHSLMAATMRVLYAWFLSHSHKPWAPDSASDVTFGSVSGVGTDIISIAIQDLLHHSHVTWDSASVAIQPVPTGSVELVPKFFLAQRTCLYFWHGRGMGGKLREGRTGS